MALKKEDFDKICRSDNNDFIDEVYRKILNRSPDNDGINNFMNAMKNGMTKEQVIFEILVSKEGLAQKERIEGFNIGEISLSRLLDFNLNETFIDAIYIAILGRSSDGVGKANYLNKLDYGEMDRVQVINELMESDEGKNNLIHILGLKEVNSINRKKSAIYKIPIYGQIKKNVDEIIKMKSIIKILQNKVETQYLVNNEKNIHINCLENRITELEKESFSVNGKDMPDDVFDMYLLMTKR